MKYKTILILATLACISGLPALAADKLYDNRFNRWQENAEKGDAFSQYSLGKAYLRGNEVEMDTKKAIEWFSRAAKQGHAKSEYKLGFMYYTGKGVARNYRTALDWFKRSASREYPPAQFYAGKMLAEGQGQDRDLGAAKEWLSKAADAGYRPARGELANVEELIADNKRPPVRRKPVKRVAKAAPKPKPTSKSSAYDTMPLLLRGGWRQDNRQSEILPSEVNKCTFSGDVVTCKTGERTRNNVFASINYSIETKISRFKKDGSFMLKSQEEIIFSIPTDPDDPEPDPENVPQSGPRSPVLMKCEFDGDDEIHCNTDSFQQVHFLR